MKEPEPPPPPKRNTWISPALAKQLLRDCQEIERLDEGHPISEEVALRLHLWPETGWSLAQRIILAEVCWMEEPAGQAPPVAPPGFGNKGTVNRFLDYWLSQVDERFSLWLPGSVEACQALGSTHVNIDWDGSFEPYTLRLPDEKRLRNPSVLVLGV